MSGGQFGARRPQRLRLTKVDLSWGCEWSLRWHVTIWLQSHDTLCAECIALGRGRSGHHGAVVELIDGTEDLLLVHCNRIILLQLDKASTDISRLWVTPSPLNLDKVGLCLFVLLHSLCMHEGVELGVELLVLEFAELIG